MKVEELITKSEKEKLLKQKKKKDNPSTTKYWIGLVVIGILFAVFVTVVTSMPQNPFKSFMEEHPYLFVILLIVIGIIYMPIVLHLNKKMGDFDKEICERVNSSDANAQEMMDFAEEYGLQNMFFLALDKRLKELGIDKVPDSCKDGYVPFRLPTKEDLD